MNYNIIGTYPSILDETQLKSYISVLLNVAAVDGVSEKEMELIEQLAKNANVSEDILRNCLDSFRTFDLSNLPDYNKQWAYCIMRDAILIADCDDGISDEEIQYLSKVSSFAGIEADFQKIYDLTLSHKRNAEIWESMLAS
jgi:hypothetical protein